MINHSNLGFDIKRIEFENNTKILINKIKSQIKEIPAPHSKKTRKLQLFFEELEYINSTIKKIKEILIPYLESRLDINLGNQELILFALSRPSIKNVFLQLKDHFKRRKSFTISSESFKMLSSAGDIGNALALIGDSVLGLIVIQYLWDSSLTTVGYLTQEKNRLVSNENLSRICDELNLYEYRLNRLNVPRTEIKGETIEHEKGTLFEALIGALYIEKGYQICYQIVIPFLE